MSDRVRESVSRSGMPPLPAVSAAKAGAAPPDADDDDTDSRESIERLAVCVAGIGSLLHPVPTPPTTQSTPPTAMDVESPVPRTESTRGRHRPRRPAVAVVVGATVLSLAAL